MAKVYLSLGSNVGDRVDAIQKAISLLANTPEITVDKVSSFYETEPLEYPDQNWFVNAVVEIETALPPDRLLESIQTIEDQLQRTRTIRWGPRTIDIDILLYDDEITCSSKLQIPHLRMHLRTFVLVPLIEIGPKAFHPVMNKTVEELYALHLRKTEVRKFQDIAAV